jgi:outer membrane lipoprotein-sorting protein
MKSVTAFLALLLLTASGCGKQLDPSFEGTIAIHTTFSSGGTKDETMEFKNGKCRMQFTSSVPGSGWFYVVFDTRLRELVIVIDKEKAFTKADYATVLRRRLEDASSKRTATDEKSSSTVAGFACSNWEVRRNYNGAREEVCATPFLDLEAQRDRATGLPDPTLFPLRIVEFDSKGKESTREEVVRIERGVIEDARFAIPVGYTELKEQPH